MYFLAVVLTGSPVAAVIAAVIYAQAKLLFSLEWNLRLTAGYSLLPLLYLSSINIFKQPTMKSAIVFGGLLVLLGITSLQLWSYSVIVLLCGFAFFWFLTNDPQKNRMSYLYVGGVIFSLIVLSPILWYHNYFISRFGFTIPLQEIITLNKTFFITAIDAIITAPSYIYNLFVFFRVPPCFFSIGRGCIEVAVVLFVVYSVVDFIKSSVQKNFVSTIMVWLEIMCCVIVIFSLGPYIQLLGHTITLPYYYVYRFSFLFESIRQPSRILLFAYPVIAVVFARGIYRAAVRFGFLRRVFLFVFLIAFIFEASHYYKPVYEKQTAFEEPVWKELSKDSYGVFAPWKGPIEDNYGYMEANDHFSFFIHQKPSVWGYVGLTSKTSLWFLEYLYNSPLHTKEKLRTLSFFGIHTLVARNTDLVNADTSLLHIKYHDTTHTIFSIDEQKVSVQPITTHIAMRCFFVPLRSSNAACPEKNSYVVIQMTNASENPYMQKTAREFLSYEVWDDKRLIQKGSSWVQYPYVVPKRAHLDAVMKIPLSEKRISSTTQVILFGSEANSIWKKTVTCPLDETIEML
jgi:hypothetical protein